MDFQSPNPKFTDEFFKMINAAKSVVVTSHTSPDDDSIGSVLSIFWTLKDKYPQKKVEAIYTGEKDERYEKFAGYDKINFVLDLADHLGGVDLLIMLDGGGFGRFSKKPDEMRKFSGKTICIDHHSSPPDRFDQFLLCPQLPASCLIIYEQFYKNSEISQPIGEALLLGLLGDTGNFSYLRPSDIGAFDMAKRLIEILGIQIQEFMARYNIIPFKTLKLIGELINTALVEKVEGWDGFSWTYIERGDYSDNEISDASHIYLGHYVRVIKEAPWGFAVIPKSDGSVYVSFRSLPGSVNVREIVEKLQIGGGHDRAAGSTFKPTGSEKVKPLDCYKQIKNWLTKNKQVTS